MKIIKPARYACVYECKMCGCIYELSWKEYNTGYKFYCPMCYGNIIKSKYKRKRIKLKYEEVIKND